MENWFIRATTKDGKSFTKDFWRGEAIIVFKNLYHSAVNNVLPAHNAIPKTWMTEIFKEFVDPNGVVFMFELVAYEHIVSMYGHPLVFNAMWYEVDSEGRQKLEIHHPASLEYKLTEILPHTNGEYIAMYEETPVMLVNGNFGHYHPLSNEELSADWHMGYYQSPTIIKDHEALHAKVLKERSEEPKESHWVVREDQMVQRWGEEMTMSDFMAEYELQENEMDDSAKEGIAMTFTESCTNALTPKSPKGTIHNFDKFIQPPHAPEKIKIVKVTGEAISHTISEGLMTLAPKAIKGTIHDSDDWYSAPTLAHQMFQIYVSGIPMDVIVDNIDFMREIHQKTAGGHTLCVTEVSGSIEMPQGLYDVLNDFLAHKIFKIGANLADQPLANGYNASYSIFWDPDGEEVLYTSPFEKTTDGDEDQDTFDFDDVNL